LLSFDVLQVAGLAVLPDSREEVKSIKEIAQAMGLEITSYVD
jgi:hypothetical protein